VTAVQVKPVSEPSEWQKKYTRYSKVQHELLGKAKQDPANQTRDNQTTSNTRSIA
jgi:hypothetical protein